MIERSQVNTERKFLDIMAQLLKRAQSVLVELYDGDNLPFEQVEQRTFFGNTGYRTRLTRRPLSWSVAHEVMFNLENDSIAKQTAEFLESHRPFSSHLNKMVGTSFTSDRIFTATLVEQILRYYLTRKGSFKNDSRLLRAVVSALLQHFNRKSITSTYHQFLTNVVPRSKRTSFDSIRMVRLEAKDLEVLCNNNAYFRWYFDSHDHRPPRPNMAMLTLTIHDAKVVGERPPSTVEIDRYSQFRDIVNSLRLVSKSPIGSSGFQMDTHVMPFYNIGGVMGTPTYCRPPAAEQLETSSLQSARAMYKLLNAVGRNKSNVAKLALSRLESADTRTSPEDRLLDLFIGFEAIVLGHLWNQGKVQGELKFRLSLTTSKYLGRNQKDSEHIYNVMRHGYDLRSSVIHGNTIDATKLSETLSDLSDIYKKLTRKWCSDIVKGSPPDPLKLLL